MFESMITYFPLISPIEENQVELGRLRHSPSAVKALEFVSCGSVNFQIKSLNRCSRNK